MKILVFIESNNGNIKRTSTEAISAAKKLNAEVVALGINLDQNAADQAAKFGANVIINASHDLLSRHSSQAVAKVVSAYTESNGINTVFISANATGKEIAPRVAVHLKASFIADAVEITEDLTVTKPVYAGKAQIKIKGNVDNNVITLRPNVFTATESAGSNTLENYSAELSDSDFGVVVTDVQKSSGKIDVAEASTIVSGGRGLKEAEHFNLVEGLAESLGAAVGASRAVVDAGWRPHSEQVGQTGKTVSPNLYVAVGISGAVQHLAGMSSSKVILAINKDKDAPIFKVADYGIVGDAFEVVPKLKAKIEAIG